jgi:hypothetical protein
MKYALLILNSPDFSGSTEFHDREAEKMTWFPVAAAIRRVLESHRHIEALAPGAWQVDLANNPDGLADLHQALKNSPYPYRILFFPEAPQWIGRMKPV